MRRGGGGGGASLSIVSMGGEGGDFTYRDCWGGEGVTVGGREGGTGLTLLIVTVGEGKG